MGVKKMAKVLYEVPVKRMPPTTNNDGTTNINGK
jgi:hypothetical protein